MCDEKASDYLTELTKNGPVKLEIYGHQVGGHSLLMKIGKAICKPLLPREHFFYTSIPQEIRDFTPAYHGRLGAPLVLRVETWTVSLASVVRECGSVLVHDALVGEPLCCS